jgi:rhodanese-related sulfurtransferase
LRKIALTQNLDLTLVYLSLLINDQDEFNETPREEATPSALPPHLEGADPETPVMMYCTGGIRCDVYSAYLKAKGFSNLYTLQGGVQNYLARQGGEGWNGSLFVFDARMAIRPDMGVAAEAEALPAAAPCRVCGGEAALPHGNCANIDCNRLFLACEACKSALRGCCCEACVDAPRLLRPVKSAGLYGHWTQYVAGEEVDAQQKAMASGRGDRRIGRRRKRQQAQHEREIAKRATRVERRRHAKEVMAAAVREQVERKGAGEGDEQGSAGVAASLDSERQARMQRLRELRERLLDSSGAR